jgi:hypothetical protein
MTKEIGLIAVYSSDEQLVRDSYGSVLVFKNKEHIERVLKDSPYRAYRLTKETTRTPKKKEVK